MHSNIPNSKWIHVLMSGVGGEETYNAVRHEKNLNKKDYWLRMSILILKSVFR